MNHNRASILTALVLVIMSITCIGLRIKYTRKPYLSKGFRAWRLTYDISLTTIKGGKAHIAIPQDTSRIRIYRESFSHRGIWVDTLMSRKTLEREASVVPVLGYERGRFIAEFDMTPRANRKAKSTFADTKLSAEDRSHYLRDEKAIQVASPEVSNIVIQLQRGQTTKADLLESIFEYCSENITRGGKDAASDAKSTLKQGFGSTLGCARAMVALCRAGKIPARLAVGFILEDAQNARTHYWVEVFSKKNWRPYDPENGYSGNLPISFLPIRRGGIEIVRTSKACSYESKYSIHRLSPPPTLAESQDNRLWGILDLTRLPSSMQTIVGLILLLPIGALITAVFRNIIGLRTFGTFTPSLIALSFVQADWRTGVVVLSVVLCIGVLARLLLNKLKLLMVSRLSIILTLVVLCMIMAVSIMDYFRLTPSASAVLLPMVILTMMIERFNITCEEEGYLQALKILTGTLMVVICCFPILRVEEVSRLVLTFPEVHLFTAALLLLIGRYSGYRLSELWRFRDFAKLENRGT